MRFVDNITNIQGENKKQKLIVFTIIHKKNKYRKNDCFGHGFHALSVIKYLKVNSCQMGDPGTKSYVNGSPRSNMCC